MLSGVIAIKKSLFYLFLVIFFGMGFGFACWLKFPWHIVKKWFYGLLGRRSVPAILITRTGELVADIKKTESETIRTKDGKGLILRGTPLNILGLGHGYVWYEEHNAPIALDPETLSVLRDRQIKEATKEENLILPVFRLFSPDYMRQVWGAWARRASALAEAKVKRKSELLLIVLACLVVISLILGFLTYKGVRVSIQGVGAIIQQLQAGGYGIK